MIPRVYRKFGSVHIDYSFESWNWFWFEGLYRRNQYSRCELNLLQRLLLEAAVATNLLPLCLMSNILNYFYHCVGCGKSWGDFQWLCPLCEMSFLKKIRLRERQISKQITHSYLIEWEKGDGLKPLIHSLKGGGRTSVYKMLTPFWTGSLYSGPIYYPSSGKRDHAFEIASAVGQFHNKEILGLVKKESQKQALLSLKERRKKKFESLSGRVSRANLVDDIVTSGATAESCWRALGQPSKMTVWSLFYRKSL